MMDDLEHAWNDLEHAWNGLEHGWNDLEHILCIAKFETTQ